jgi:Carbohydrate binding module (family 6).
MNYSIDVKTAGTYTIDLMYTACGDGVISFDLNGKALTGKLKVLSTKSDKEPLAWRQWHHWNRMVSLATVRLKKGIQVLTLRVVSNGNMNFDFLDFKLNKSK